MSKVAVVFWSGTGNTEAMAEQVAAGVRGKGGEAELIQASDFSTEKIDAFDAFAFGCPAMGDEELEDSEFLPMYDEVEPAVAATNKKVVLFGSYEWNEGEWMELWEQRAEEAGLNVQETVTAYDSPDEDACAECVRAGGMLAE